MAHAPVRNQVVPIVATLKLDHCWCCHVRGVAFEEHHVVPRHLGGEHGPTVSLCGSCHTQMHTYALQLYRNTQKRTDPQQLFPARPQTQARFEYLADVIVRASIAIEGHAGKKWKYATEFSDAEHNKLVSLAGIYKSQDAAVHAALALLHAKHFTCK
jgi:hypothetical protein